MLTLLSIDIPTKLIHKTPLVPQSFWIYTLSICPNRLWNQRTNSNIIFEQHPAQHLDIDCGTKPKNWHLRRWEHTLFPALVIAQPAPRPSHLRRHDMRVRHGQLVGERQALVVRGILRENGIHSSRPVSLHYLFSTIIMVTQTHHVKSMTVQYGSGWLQTHIRHDCFRRSASVESQLPVVQSIFRFQVSRVLLLEFAFSQCWHRRHCTTEKSQFISRLWKKLLNAQQMNFAVGTRLCMPTQYKRLPRLACVGLWPLSPEVSATELAPILRPTPWPPEPSTPQSFFTVSGYCTCTKRQRRK